MKKITIMSLFVFTLVLVGCGSQVTEEGTASMYKDLDVFAACMTENNVVMYGTTTCAFCNKQKEMFGSSFENVTFVNCLADPTACTIKNIESVPTRLVNNTDRYEGLQSLEDLSALSGCPLEKNI